MSNSDKRSQWTDERLDRLADDIEANNAAIFDLRSGLSDVKSAAESLVQVAQIHQADIEVLSRDMQGLKLEVRRLVEELRDRRNE